MKDYLKEFKKQKFRKNTLIVLSSLAFAFVINGFLFGTPVGNKLQTSVKNATTTKTTEAVKSDIYLQLQGTGADTLDLKIGTELKQVSEVRLSIVTNPDINIFKINNIYNDEDKNLEIIKISNTPGITSLTFKFQTPVNLTPGYTLANIIYTKKEGEKVAVNLTETMFVSGKDSFEINNSGAEF
ncbi:MAG: hypothetical protein PHZ26_04615 [Candidatus Gracilibacteria bacterium]|nr:hypothetical protein [Candidatus Gracilibacteria bacterium]